MRNANIKCIRITRYSIRITMIDTINVYLRVKKEEIYLICPFFEAFEGMAAIRTPRPEAGDFATLKLMVSPDFQTDFAKVLKYLGTKINFELLPA